MFSSKSFEAMLMMMATLLCASASAKGDDTETVTGIFSANTGIAMWVNPNALVGITIVLMFFWVCYCVLGMLAAVQTPRIMLEKTIDWGKVERVEE